MSREYTGTAALSQSKVVSERGSRFCSGEMRGGDCQTGESGGKANALWEGKVWSRLTRHGLHHRHGHLHEGQGPSRCTAVFPASKAGTRPISHSSAVRHPLPTHQGQPPTFMSQNTARPKVDVVASSRACGASARPALFVVVSHDVLVGVRVLSRVALDEVARLVGAESGAACALFT